MTAGPGPSDAVPIQGRSAPTGPDAPDRMDGAVTLAELDAGRIRAARPDPIAPGGWRVDPDVEAAILALLRRPADADVESRRRLAVPRPGRAAAQGPARRPGGARPSAPPAGRGGSSRAGRRPGRRLPRPGRRRHAAVLRERRRLDRRGHDGRLARPGRLVRPDRRAGPPLRRRHDRRRARAAGRAARSSSRTRRSSAPAVGLLEGVLVGRAAVIGAGRHPDRDDAPVRPGPRARHRRHARRAARRARRARSSCPGARACGGDVRGRHGLAVAAALVVKERDAGTDARVALEGGASMTAATAAVAGLRRDRCRPTGRARRDPPSRWDPAASIPSGLAAAFGTPFYVYDLDVVERPVAGPAGGPAAALRARVRGQGEPALAVVAHIGALGLGADIASGGELETVAPGGRSPPRRSS